MTTLLMSEHCWSLQNVRGKFMVLFAPSHILFRPQMFGPIISLSYSVTFPAAFFFYLAFIIIGVCLNSYRSPTWKNTLLIAASLAHRPIYMLQDLKPILKCSIQFFFTTLYHIFRSVYFFTLIETSVCVYDASRHYPSRSRLLLHFGKSSCHN